MMVADTGQCAITRSSPLWILLVHNSYCYDPFCYSREPHFGTSLKSIFHCQTGVQQARCFCFFLSAPNYANDWWCMRIWIGLDAMDGHHRMRLRDGRHSWWCSLWTSQHRTTVLNTVVVSCQWIKFVVSKTCMESDDQTVIIRVFSRKLYVKVFGFPEICTHTKICWLPFNRSNWNAYRTNC